MQLIDLDAAQRADSLDNIVRAGQHLLELINELLDHSLIEAGQLTTSVENIDADDVIDEALRILQPLADSRDISLSRGLYDASIDGQNNESGRPAVLRADRQCLRQVLINLVGNAVKFTPPGGQVSILVTGATEETVRISVLDSGPGIPADAIDGLFLPFHRLAPDAHPEAEGTGLGLSVAAKLVDEMQGKIGVQSEVGVGSCFWVDLPGGTGATGVTEDDASGEGGQQTTRKTINDHPTSGIVLYVEDDQACVKVMTAAMALRPGITLLTAETVESGLALIRSNNVDAILLDIGLPDGSGWDLLRTIREDAATASIPAVVVTAGHGRVPNDTVGPEQVMTKPLDIGVCIETLDGLLSSSP
jgi:CheY-like chemotaxis protein